MICTISMVSLMSGSKPMLPPGDDSNIKPKSMWMMWPWSLSMMLPLCRSLICSRKPTTEYAAMLLMKFCRAYSFGERRRSEHETP